MDELGKNCDPCEFLNDDDFATIIYDDSLNVVWINDIAQRFFGVAANSIVGESMTHFHTKYLAKTTGLKDNSKNRQFRNFNCTVVVKEGDSTLALNALVQSILSGPYKGGVIENYFDTSLMDRINDLLVTQNKILQMIASGKNLKTIFENLCILIERQSTGASCSLLLLNKNGTNLRAGAGGENVSQEYLELIDGLTIGKCAGSCGTAAFTGKPVYVNDVCSDHRWSNFLEVADRFNIKACWSTPFYSKNGKVLGTFAISHGHPCTPSAFDEKLLQTARNLAAIAFEHDVIGNESAKTQTLESIGNLAAGLAHDFNNLLTCIMGNISLAKLDIDANDDIYKILSSAEKASLKAKDITQQLLTFSQGGAPLALAESISDLVKETTEFMLSGSSVKCVFDIPDDIPNVFIDRTQISQVIQNILNNSIQSMAGGGTIKLSLKTISHIKDLRSPLADGDYVKIIIADEGIGIPDKHLMNIFDPFFSTKDFGRGLGLSICHSIMKQHSGYIDVESTLGSGTQFYLYLPVSHLASGIDKKIDVIAKGNNSIVLVMDDESYIHELVSQMLKKLGYETVHAEHGEEAIKIIEKAYKGKNQINICILDLTVPGAMGGEQALKHIRKINPNITALASSGYANNPVLSNYRNHGFDGILTKPYSIQGLSDTFEAVLHEKNTR